MLRLAFDFIITWRETRTRPNAYDRTDSRSIPLSTFAYEKAAGIHNAADNPNTTGVRLIP